VQTSVPMQLSEEAAGVTVLHAILPSWRQTLTVGYHNVSGPRDPNRSFLLDLRLPLGANHETATRTALRYATAVDLNGERVSATLSGGAEHANRTLIRSVRLSAASRQLVRLFEDDISSTGLYGQARVRLGSRLVASGGTRAEWSSTLDNGQGAAWASTMGASWNQPLGSATLRLRAAWGRGLRLPEPGMGRAMSIATVEQVANDELVPERQSGVEVGADLYLAQGSWLRATWFDQRADNLIQQVRVRTDGTLRSFQWQNVGAISNRGTELEAGARFGALSVVAMAYFTQSTVDEVALRYTGYLRPGDPLPDVPGSVGSLALRYASGRVTMEVGGSWLGEWTGFDRAAAVAAEAGQAPERNSPRDFWISYPGVTQPWFAASADLGGGVSAFLRADNPAQTERFIRDNLSPPIGRTTVVGVTIQR
jgi:outer membrane receptor protein involved in Fe transport